MQKYLTKNTTAKETAKLLGVTVKALRVYEKHGLISPGRTQAGWRVYGPVEYECLLKVITLKTLGLSLAEIKNLLDGNIALGDILATQKQALEKQCEVIGQSLVVIADAQEMLSAGESLSADHLIELIKETAALSEWTEQHEAFAKKYFTSAELSDFAQLKTTIEGQIAIRQAWDGVIEDAEALRLLGGDKTEISALAKRWKSAMEIFTKNDPALEAATSKWLEEGFANPQSAKLMPFSKDLWLFMKQAIGALEN